ncbi:hypothetical protein SCORR_v1c01550 [Spiroplasma corruscae]|uniref:Uncharacterized protein n=1 Tax=Spiroplasma corruscae TaxID=216934 RepID=A0A222EN52_9MOLU|nr:hypothetical protein [Spiroplasma corruscae]ASP27930.1 hypothetical protein SCORR_v1c01550 [Spiroplasma corruscae]
MRRKKVRNSSKYGVFKGNIINSETILENDNLTVEEYNDDDLSIKIINKNVDSEDDKLLIQKRKNKKNFFVYKVFGYIIILLLLIVFLIVIIVLK